MVAQQSGSAPFGGTPHRRQRQHRLAIGPSAHDRPVSLDGPPASPEIGMIATAIIEDAVPALVVARDLMDRFRAMIRRRNSTDLEPWFSDAAPSRLGSFVRGIVQDRAGVHAVLTQP